MGQKSDTIFTESIRYFLFLAAKQQGVIASGSDTVPADFHVPADFDFEQAPPRFQQKVLRRMLENFITEFEEMEDLPTLPEDSLKDIKDGLIKVRNGFISLNENDNQDKDFKIKLAAVKTDLTAVNDLLKSALSYLFVAISELEDNKGKKTYEYFHSLEECRDVMSNIKMHLRAWPE